MKVLFLCRLFYPHIGGVEKHVLEVSKKLTRRGIKITVVTGKYDESLDSLQILDGISIVRISPPKVRFLGLFYIWFWFLKNISLIKKSDIIHAHDVSVWYLPLRILLPNKPFYSTFHGWEGVYPIPYENILIKRLSAMISDKIICVGKYIEKYYGIKANLITYGAVNIQKNNIPKRKNRIVYVGRLEPDTGLMEFLKFLKKNRKYKVNFCGDGNLRNRCGSFGTVIGFVDPKPYLNESEYCIPGGYLSALEAMGYRCKIKVFWGSEIKKDYWQTTPFYKWIKSEDTKSAYNWTKTQTWVMLAKDYLRLWGVNSSI